MKIHGFTRTDNRGKPRCILHTELQNSKLPNEQHNIVKVALLEGDSIIQDLIAISS